MYIDLSSILELVKLKLKNDSISDTEINYAIEEIVQVVSNYCNLDIDKIPKALQFTVANMVVDLVKSQNLNSLDPSDIQNNVGIGSIASVKSGDTEIKFTRNGNGTGAHVSDVDSVTMNYKAQLNKFRRIKW